MRSSNLCTPELRQVEQQLSEEVQWKLELTCLQNVGGSFFRPQMVMKQVIDE